MLQNEDMDDINRDRRGEDEAPDAEEVLGHRQDRHDEHRMQLHHPAEALRPINLFQIFVGPASARHGRAQFGDYQAVADGKRRTENPSDERLRTVHRGNHQRQRDEWADADHVQHVQRDGTAEAHAADQILRWLRRMGL